MVLRRQRTCLSKTAARPTDDCSSVGRTKLSDTGVSDELTVVGQVTRGVAGQGPVDESRSLEHDALPHMKPVQLAEHRRDMIASPSARHELGGSIQSIDQSINQKRIRVTKVTNVTARPLLQC